MIHIDEHRRLEESAFPRARATEQDARTLGDRVVDVVLHDRDLGRGDHRSDVTGEAAGLVHALPQRSGFTHDQ